MKRIFVLSMFLAFVVVAGSALALDEVPDVIMMPGTQPGEANIEDPGRCLNCHEGYETNPRVEPGFGWLGSAMGNAGRDPIFWATLAIAEQDFDGAGDLCIRCHSSGGWIGGRSTPTDGSGLAASDENGIDCDTCHQMTDPDMQVVSIDGTPIIGTMTDPFINNSGDSLDPALAGEGYYGSGMYALSNDYGKLGPYDEGDAVARHQFTGSDFHRDVDFCGTCHDVSNSAVGQLAPNAGTQPGSPAVIRSGEVGYPLNPDLPINDPAVLDGMAAFNNPPYAYGIVERTYSEYKSSPLSSLLMDDFNTLPADLQDPRGSLYTAYMAATTDGTRSANYIDGDPKYFSCQGCHMRSITGRGCDKNDAPNRLDQPMHDQTGGNYWVYPLIQYQDQQGTLRLGGGLSALQIEAQNDGTLRAKSHLTQAGTLDVNGDLVRITNMTGHKLISGYPEGRRMWLNIKWYDNQGVEMTADEVGAFGDLPTTATNPVDGSTFTPKSIVNLEDPRLKVYEVHPSMTKEWADVLRSIGYPATMPLSFDRLTGQPDYTLGQLAAQAPGTYHETFHFVLNNYVAFDNRIPPYQMSYDEAQKRNALPVPANQYGGTPGGVYQHWDEFDIRTIAPQGAQSAELTLYYQGTSWEYVQFLNNAVSNTPTGTDAPNPVTPFLADEGKNFLDAWVNAVDANGQTMVPPYAMATATWSGDCIPEPEICDDGVFCNGSETCDVNGQCQPGTPPSIDDGVACTDDSCDEVNDTVVHAPNDGLCDNGQFCDGSETCDPVNDCQAGTPPVVDDGVGCTDDSCDEVNDVIVNSPNDGNCGDGAFCNGSETCDPVNDCQAGTPPCDPATETCDETQDICEPLSGIPGDCNNDGIVSAGDMTAMVLENFDGDGNLPADAPGGTFPGDPVGCDANEDGIISAGDMTCVVLLVFNGPGACGS